MIKKIVVSSLIFLLVLVLLTGCTKSDFISGTGEIIYDDLEGGFYGIVSSDGDKYDPVNLPEEYKIDGLPVEFKLVKSNDTGSVHMWGTIVYVHDITVDGTIGVMTSSVGCKDESLLKSVDSDQDCVEYTYENDILHLKHVNAGFNCCPVFKADITIEDNVIMIDEIEIEGVCRCLCLFDLNYIIFNLNAGEYTIKIVEPYVKEDDEPFEFTVDLSSLTSGSHCVTRTYYPWDTI